MSKENRVSRKEARRQELAKQRQTRLLQIGVPVVALLVALVALVVSRVTEPEVAGAVFVESAIPNQHDTEISYGFGGLPPTGGVHQPTWQNCGIYTEPVLAEYAIHSMEHGAVWVTYHPELPAEQVQALQETVRGDGYLLLSPYPDQSSDIVLTAWDVQLQVDSSGDPRIEEFIQKYRRTRGPETAACSGGIGQPVG
ncbi:MAG: DUF3105 domain-containing protein [Anaerolineales bacterium]|nr:DUF3105 domain-containing protein [Anaerolineales bacterium]